jgi:hypothetical protein
MLSLHPLLDEDCVRAPRDFDCLGHLRFILDSFHVVFEMYEQSHFFLNVIWEGLEIVLFLPFDLVQAFFKVFNCVVVWLKDDLRIVVEVDTTEVCGKNVAHPIFVRVVNPFFNVCFLLVVPVSLRSFH